MEWHCVTSVKKQDEVRTVSLPFKVTGTVMWDTEGWMLVDFLHRGKPLVLISCLDTPENVACTL
jgi:hypothetical protein